MYRFTRLHLIAQIGERVAGRAAFICGAGGNSDTESEAMIAAAAQAGAGAGAAVVVTPSRHADDMDCLAGFYRLLSAAADVPLMLQNAPMPMGLGLSPAALIAIVRAAPGIRYVKEETFPCGQRITALREQGDGLLDGVFSGAPRRRPRTLVVRTDAAATQHAGDLPLAPHQGSAPSARPDLQRFRARGRAGTRRARPARARRIA